MGVNNTGAPWADIVAEMRDMAADAIIHGTTVAWGRYSDVLIDFADRIESKAKREGIRRDKTSFHCGDCAKFGFNCDAGDVDGNEDCLACENFVRGDHFRGATKMVGNAAKLRKALEKIIDLERTMQEGINRAGYATGGEAGHYFYKSVQLAKSALAAPPRNCDVGSPTEQAERFKRFCKEHTDSGRNPSCGMCPILPAINRGGTEGLCPFHWGQLPYDVTQEGDG